MRIAIVTHSWLVSDVIANILREQIEMQVVAVSDDVSQVYELAERVDVILLHHLLPQPGALKLVRLIQRDTPGAHTIVIGAPSAQPELLCYIEAGADGYVCDGHSSERLLETIRAACDGQALIDPPLAAALMHRAGELQRRLSLATSSFLDGAATLTPRELTVLELLRQGYTNAAIASELFIEAGTVKNHVQSVLRKLNLSRRGEAARYAGLVSALHSGGSLSGLP